MKIAALVIFAVVIATYPVKEDSDEISCDDDDGSLQICPPMNNFNTEF